MRHHWSWPWIKRALGIAFLAVVAFLLVRYARTVDWGEVRTSIQELPRDVLLKALAFAIVAGMPFGTPGSTNLLRLVSPA